MQRKDAILLSASDHFGRFGFRGASLRDIASDAGVSLTLLNHHFGCKASLLAAVVDVHHPMLEERAAVLRRMSRTGPGTFTPRDLVQAWIRIGFETASEPNGELFLRLLARVLDDPAEEGVQVVENWLDEASLAFIDALQQCYPQATRRAAALACIWVNASLLKVLTGARRMLRLAGADRPEDTADDDQSRLLRFLVAGIDASLLAPRPAAAILRQQEQLSDIAT